MTADKVIQEADALHEKGAVQDYYQLLRSGVASFGDNAQVLWRYGRACYDMNKELTNKEEQVPIVEEGLGAAKKAIELDDKHYQCHKWYAILLAESGGFKGQKEKIADAYVIREHFQKSAELNPQDVTTQHCLGKWCWSIVQISWLERQAAALLFGTPPTSSYEECEEFLKNAYKLDPTMIHNNLLLGDLYYQQSKYADAKEWYTKAAQCKPINGAQAKLVEEAEGKIGKC